MDEKHCIFTIDEQITLIEILNKQIEETHITEFKKYLQGIRKKIGV